MRKPPTSVTLTPKTLVFLDRVSDRNGISRSKLIDIISEMAEDYFESTGVLDSEINVRQVPDGRSTRWKKED